MLLRRTTPLAIALLALACEPSVPFDTANNPSQVDYAAFDPTGTPPATGPDIPLPNDLALQPQAIATQSGAQQALLKQWAVEGFPNDQEVPITIDFVTEKLDANTGAATRVPTDLESRQMFNDYHAKLAPHREDVATWFDMLDLDDFVTFGGKP